MKAASFRAGYVWIIVAVAQPSFATVPCIGDCDGIGGVTPAELVTGLDGALGAGGSDPCGDANNDHQVTVDEVVGAVNNAAVGCPSDGTPTPTQTASPTATPIAGGPVDEAILGTWSGTARNESTGLVKSVRIKVELQGNNVVVTDLGGNLYKTAPAAITMSAPTRTTLTYNVLGNPVITFSLTLAGNQLAGIYAATTPPSLPDAVGVVLTKEVPLTPDARFAGTWSGTGSAFPGGPKPMRVKLEVQGSTVLITDLIGDLFVDVPSSLTAHPDGMPTALNYICDSGPCGNGNPIVTLNIILLANGRLVVNYYVFTASGQVSTSGNLARE